MCDGFSIGAILMVFCVPLTSSELVVSKINIGIIADKQSVQQHQPVYTNITHNVTIEWHFVDFSEVFHVFRKISYLDLERADVDIIVLLGYCQRKFAALPGTKYKRILTLSRDAYVNDQSILEHWRRKLANISLPNEATRGTPHCKVHTDTQHNDSFSPIYGQTTITTPTMILANLVTKRGWEYICVFHDQSTESNARLFIDEISQRGTAFVIQNVDKTNDLHGIMLRLYNEAVTTTAQKIRFVVICRLNCLMKVFLTANEFDSKNTEYPTILKLFSRWIAIVYDYSHHVASLLQTAAHDLNNVAVVPVPGLNPPSTESIPERLQYFLNEIGMQNFSYEIDSKARLVDDISKVITYMEPTSQCSHYVIETLLFTKTGREFHTIGYADLNGNIALETDMFPNIHYGYSRRRFKVVIVPYMPWINEVISDKNETTYNGVCIDLVDEIARVLNFTYTLIRAPDGLWGAVERTVNGTDMFNGMVGMVQRREVDFAATPMTIIPLRDNVVDFTYPVKYEFTSVMVKMPDPNALKWRTLINPFKVEVLFYIGLSLVVVTFLIFLTEKFGAYYTVPENSAARKLEGGLHHIHDSFWYMYGALLCQGGVRLPDSVAGRTLVSTWWLFCIIIVATYCGNLVAFLTVSKHVAPFKTLDEMLSLKGQYRWGTQGGTVWQTIFTTSRNPTFHKVGVAMLEFNKTDPRVLDSTFAVQINNVLEGNYAWIASLTTIQLELAKYCDLTTIKEGVLPITNALAFQQNSPHTAAFSEQIIKSHEAGLFEIWRRKWWPQKNFCPDTTKLEAKPITLLDVQSAFYICLIGLFGGTVTCIIEVILFRCRKRRRNSEPNPVEHVTNSS